MLGRGACPRRELLDQKRTPGTADRLTAGAAPDADQGIAPGTGPVPEPLPLPDAA